MPKRMWVSSLPTITPEAKWTPEEDQELLELDKKFHGRWEDIPGLSHSTFECDVRRYELKQQMRKAKLQQDEEPKLMFPPENLDPQSRNATQLVSKAHKEAVNSLIGSGSAQLGTVAADISASLRATREIDAAMIISLKDIMGSVFNISVDEQLGDTTIIKLGECEEKAVELSKERDQLSAAIQEACLWRTALGKARDHVAFLEAAVARAEEKARNAKIDAESKDMELGEAQVKRSTKHDVESSDKNLDNPSKRLKISSNHGEGDHHHLSGGSQGAINPTTIDAHWNDN